MINQSKMYTTLGNTVRNYLQCNVYQISLYALMCEATRFAKISFMVGSKACFFSAAQCIAPLIGYYQNTTNVCLLFFMRTCVSLFLTGASALLLQLHLPTAFAGIYSATCRSEKLAPRILMATSMITCMILFVLHPVGSDAFAYTIPWLIPAINACITHPPKQATSDCFGPKAGVPLHTASKGRHIFIHALATTYSAHAIGSVIWIYTIGPKTAQSWLALIPVACCERILFACGMTAIIMLVPIVKGVILRTPRRLKLSSKFEN